MSRNAGTMQPYVDWLKSVTKMLKATGVWDDPGRCKALVWNRKLRGMIQCHNRRKDGDCCTVHSAARDCGDDLVYVASGRRKILAWLKRHGKR